MTTAFQLDAFQAGAFQIDGAGDVTVLVTGVYGTGLVGNVTVVTVNGWVVINTAETADWQILVDTQSPGWAAAGTVQTPGWTQIPDTQVPVWGVVGNTQNPNWQ